MEHFVDHLWQSACCAGLAWCLALLLRRNAASFRLWLWRIAALKFLLPFSLVYAVGGWIGFPVRHSAIPPPPAVVRTTDWILSLGAPLQTHATTSSVRIGASLLVLALALLMASMILRQLRVARQDYHAENTRELLGEQPAPPLSFFKAVALFGSGFLLIAAPLLAGAVQDRLHRQVALASDMRTLKTASVTLQEVATRFGGRSEVVADEHGVTIRYINLQDLVALVYGIDQFEVFGGALPWLEHPHYDVHVTGPLADPSSFDSYSLRQAVTQYLYDQYGVSIRVNGNCQEPCLNQESFVVERIPWTLSKMISGRK